MNPLACSTVSLSSLLQGYNRWASRRIYWKLSVRGVCYLLLTYRRPPYVIVSAIFLVEKRKNSVNTMFPVSILHDKNDRFPIQKRKNRLGLGRDKARESLSTLRVWMLFWCVFVYVWGDLDSPLIVIA